MEPTLEASYQVESGAGSESRGRREQEKEGERENEERERRVGEKERERWKEMHTFTAGGAEVGCVIAVEHSTGLKAGARRLAVQHQGQAACPNPEPVFSPRRPASGLRLSSLDYCRSPGGTRKERRRKERRSGG